MFLNKMPIGIYRRVKFRSWKIKDTSKMHHPAWNKDLKGWTEGTKAGFQKEHPSYHTKESKNRISDSLKKAYLEGRRISYFKGIIPWNKGRHIKTNDALEIWRKNGGEFPIGKNHYRWIEDRNILKMNKRNDPEYKQWIKKVKKRDNNTCRLENENCAGYNIVHHIKSWSEYPKLRYEVNCGITLCQAHHPKRRAEEKRLEPILMALVSVSNGLPCHVEV